MTTANRVCPCCGKDLELVAPSREYFPHTMGVSQNGIEFAAGQERIRLRSFTKSPCTVNGNVLNARDYYTHYNIGRYSGQIYKREAKGFPNVVTVPRIRRALEQGGRRMYDKDLFFQCAHCRNKLAVNENPYRTLTAFAIAWVAYIMTAGVLAILNRTSLALPLDWFFPSLAVMAVLSVGYLVWFMLCLKEAENDLNNFVPLDEYHNLITPPHELTLSKNELVKKYLKEGNVLTARTGSTEYHLYIIGCTEESLYCSVCGTGSEAKRLSEFLRTNVRTLTLTFRRRPVGTAEVTEIKTLDN